MSAESPAMTLAPETADLAAPDPSDYRPRAKAGIPGVVWALVAFGLLCVLAGIVIAVYGPRLWPVTPDTPATAASAPQDPETSTYAARDQPAPAPLAGPAPPAVTVEVGALQARIASLEAVQGRTVEAVTAALTATALSAAAAESRPFEAEAAAAQRALPMSPDVRALSRLAAQGAPSRAELSSQFADAAARSVAALRDPGPDAGLASRILHALSSVVTIRRVDAASGNSFDAILSRAEQQTASGDLEAALATLEQLPPGPQAAFADWREGAERRVEIDRRVAGLRELALAELDRAMRSRP